jgi:hypothetical protein
MNDLIFNESNGIKEYSTEQWISIVEYVLEQLQFFLNLPIEHESLEGNVGEGFSLNIWSQTLLLGPLALSWKGILGGQILNNSRLNISATLFLYSQKKKLVTKEGASLLELVYEKDDFGNGNWQLDGWLKDVYYEYEFFDQDDERI